MKNAKINKTKVGGKNQKQNKFNWRLCLRIAVWATIIYWLLLLLIPIAYRLWILKQKLA